MYHISLYGYQGRKWLPKTGWASSNALRHRCLAVSSILPKTGWAITHPTVTPLVMVSSAKCTIPLIETIAYGTSQYLTLTVLPVVFKNAGSYLRDHK